MAAKKKKKPIKVRATQLGFYDNKRRREGAVFFVDPDFFSKKWMEKVGESTPESKGNKPDLGAPRGEGSPDEGGEEDSQEEPSQATEESGGNPANQQVI